MADCLLVKVPVTQNSVYNEDRNSINIPHEHDLHFFDGAPIFDDTRIAIY